METNLIDENIMKLLDNTFNNIPTVEEKTWLNPFTYIYENFIKEHFFYFIWFIIMIIILIYSFVNKKEKKINKEKKEKIRYEKIEEPIIKPEKLEELDLESIEEDIPDMNLLDERNGTRDLTKMYNELIGD